MSTARRKLATQIAVLATVERLRDQDLAGSGRAESSTVPPRFCDYVLGCLITEFGVDEIGADAYGFSLRGVTRGPGGVAAGGADDAASPLDVDAPLPPELAQWWQRRSGLSPASPECSTHGPGDTLGATPHGTYAEDGPAPAVNGDPHSEPQDDDDEQDDDRYDDVADDFGTWADWEGDTHE